MFVCVLVPRLGLTIVTALLGFGLDVFLAGRLHEQEQIKMWKIYVAKSNAANMKHRPKAHAWLHIILRICWVDGHM